MQSSSLLSRLRNSTVFSFLFSHTGTKQILLKNSFWLGAVEAFSKIIMFIVTIAIVRYFGATEFGRYNYALSFVGIAMLASDWGVSTILTREIARYPKQAGRYLADATVVKVCSAGVVLAGLFMLVPHLETAKHDLWLFVLTAAFLLFQGMEGMYTAVLAGFEKMELVFLARITHYIMVFVATLGVVFLRLTIEQMMVLYSVGVGIAMAVGAVMVSHIGVSLFARPSLLSLKAMLIEAWPLFGMLAVTQIYNNLDTILIRKFQGEEAVGLYQAAYKILFAFQAINLVSVVTFPRISALWHAREFEKLKRLAKVVVLWSVVALVPVVIGICVGSGMILRTIYGGAYGVAAPALVFLILSGFVAYFRLFASNFLLAAGRQKQIFIALVIGLAANAVLNILLIPRWGIVGAGVNMVAAEMVIILVLIYRLPFLISHK